MRIAFISDVHGNQHALEAVTSSNAFKRCDLSIFCGDIFGYFYSGKSILHLLRKNCTHMLRGNHDDFILQISKRKMDVGFYEKNTDMLMNTHLEIYQVTTYRSLKIYQ